MERKTFKTKWNETDEVCPNCNQVTKINRGLTKQNMKKMFKKPTMQDWIIFIILFLALLGTWVYMSQLNTYKELWENPEEFCQDYSEINLDSYLDDIGIQNIEIIEDNEIK